ncbi:beta-ketoacyl-ACP synthase II [Flammeovirga yaeyamensis]|uniref:3-oxoacyl-[acyl-carrier-protein] synthase 2 n=1 Tax=Flammeovirga yaeyamensis TaxID=367791 RepID=A0AAX1N935_9BACT|nr:beta-ketoacyl-ACP synthase II [Flammeovirga yaeyamensis]MBB3697495.1 3-oxoacyl-[acyl-carrier-protein] synthase II [Flammeovirga yaeyamensis]NMF36189.1 beta-ketoacyl-ACP synthase II [Flammeovirga yaeyamensis]QWG02921.1 beta-ketoacyl-ACP synthase II [Flammeovirga yaeyamensis]
MKPRRVVITGIGAITPLGNSVEEYWNNLEKGVSGAAPITKFDASKFKTQFACEVKGFDAKEYIDRKELRKMDLVSQYGVAVAKQAIDDSNLDLESVDRNRFGVIWGSGIGGLKSFQDEVTSFANGDGTPRFNPFFIPKMIPDLIPGHISMTWGLKGPNFTTVSACASATNAMVDAFNYIRFGISDLFVTGGSEAAVCEAGIGGFNALRALSTRNDSPSSASRPFDATRDGFVLGEGAGAFIFEEYEHAKARGAKIYAEVIGGGMTADAYHMTAPHPEGEGSSRVMAEAIKDAGITPEDVDYINVHGTSTPLGDIGEVNAIKKVFGESAYNVSISSTKSMTGHLLGAAGAVEALACLMSIERGVIPPTINFETPDENLDSKLDCTFNEAKKRDVNIALSNTFGFGGHNFSVIFKKVTD